MAIVLETMRQGSVLRRLCHWSPACRLGAISYSCYAFHLLLCIYCCSVMMPQLEQHMPRRFAIVTMLSLSFAVTVALGKLSYRWLEQASHAVEGTLQIRRGYRTARTADFPSDASARIAVDTVAAESGIGPFLKSSMLISVADASFYCQEQYVCTICLLRPAVLQHLAAKQGQFAITISEKSATVEKSLMICASRPRRAARRSGSGTITMTLSKKASTVGRSAAMAWRASG